MRKVIIVSILVLHCFAAHAEDPYADAIKSKVYNDAKVLIANFEYFSYADACRVSNPSGANFAWSILMSNYNYITREAGMNRVNVAPIIRDITSAIERGHNKALQTNGCDYWKEHLEEAAKVRSLANATIGR